MPTPPGPTPSALTLPGLDTLSVAGRRVFVRADLDLPLDGDAKSVDPVWVKAAVPTLDHLLRAGARVIVGAHLEASPSPEAIEWIGAALAEALGCEVRIPDEILGDGATKVAADLRDGELVLLPNLLEHPGEASNDSRFAQGLAAFAEIYVNDAAAASANNYASIAQLPTMVVERAVGRRFEREIAALAALAEAQAPFAAILQGTPFSRYAGILAPLAERLDRRSHLILGGELGALLLATSEGLTLPNHSTDDHRLAARLHAKITARGTRLHLPLDWEVGDEVGATIVRPSLAELPPGHAVLDIGPQTVIGAAAVIATARTVFWLDVGHPVPSPARARPDLARAIANAPGTTYAVGKSALTALSPPSLLEAVNHRFGGDHAITAILQGNPLVGIEPFTSKEIA